MNLSNEQLEKLKKLFDELAVSEVKVGKATKDVKKAQEDANISQDKARKSIKEIANEWAESIGNVAKKLQEASELIDVLGFGDSDLGKKLKSGADAFNKGSQAASDFATGNYIGAAINGVGLSNRLVVLLVSAMEVMRRRLRRLQIALQNPTSDCNTLLSS